MRIVGNIPHPTWKITIFHWNSKYSIKLENGPYEQIYKFRDEVPLDKVKQSVDEAFIRRAAQVFKHMHDNKTEAFQKQQREDLFGPEEII